jgi:serine/threonine protein kinase
LSEPVGALSSGGTKQYMPPEVLLKTQTRADPNTDGWSLGMMIFELVYGRDQNPLLSLLDKDFSSPSNKWNQAYQELCSYIGKTTTPLTQLILELIDRDPKKRPSVQDAYDRLQSIIPFI